MISSHAIDASILDHSDNEMMKAKVIVCKPSLAQIFQGYRVLLITVCKPESEEFLICEYTFHAGIFGPRLQTISEPVP